MTTILNVFDTIRHTTNKTIRKIDRKRRMKNIDKEIENAGPSNYDEEMEAAIEEMMKKKTSEAID